MLITTGNANIEMAKNDKFILYFAHLIVPLASPKILTLDKKTSILSTHSIRFFVSLASPKILTLDIKKTINYFFLYSLIRIFAQ